MAHSLRQCHNTNLAKQLYLYVNYDRQPKSFHLASINPVVAAPSIVSTDCANTSSGKLSPEAGGLIAIGCFLGISIIVLIVLYYLKRKEATEAAAGTSPQADTDTGAEAQPEGTKPQKPQNPIDEPPRDAPSVHESLVSSTSRVEPTDPLPPLAPVDERSDHTTVVAPATYSEFRGGEPNF
jgi:hypothetical protein